MGSAFIGKAKVRLALYSAGSTFENRPYRYVENVSNFQFSFSEEEKKLADYASASGGVDASVKRISDVSGSIDMQSPVFERVSQVAAQVGVAGDWRQPATPAAEPKRADYVEPKPEQPAAEPPPFSFDRYIADCEADLAKVNDQAALDELDDAVSQTLEAQGAEEDVVRYWRTQVLHAAKRLSPKARSK